MKYRKKPVTIEAIRYMDAQDIDEVRLFCPKVFMHNGRLMIPTLEGVHICSEGDYIIKGVTGEYYPCKPDIFKLTYEVMPEKPTGICRAISPSVDDIAAALRACATEVPQCEYPYSKDGHMSTGETCFKHLMLDAVDKLKLLNDSKKE